MRNKKGFTLIELLAVIIILGVLMIIAVPAVTKYINDSRKSGYVTTAKNIVGGARNLVYSGKLDLNDKNVTYYIDGDCIKTDNGLKSPYGDITKAYVAVVLDGDNYEYFWMSVDDTNTGVNAIKNANELDVDDIVGDIDPSTIEPNIGIDKRKTIVKIEGENCIKGNPETATRKMNTKTGKVNGPCPLVTDTIYWAINNNKLTISDNEVSGTNSGSFSKNANFSSSNTWKNASSDISRITEIDVVGKVVPNSISEWFSYVGNNATTFHADFSNLEVCNVTNMNGALKGLGEDATTWAIDGLDLWDTSNVTDMSEMFQLAGKYATSLDLSNLDTSSVVNMHNMFNYFGIKSSALNLNLSDWDTSNVTDMGNMFDSFASNTTNLTLVGLNTWDVSNVRRMDYMFLYAGKKATTFSLSLNGWNALNATKMNGMFAYTGQESETFYLNISGWNTSNVKDMSSMFYRAGEAATNWEILGLNTWDTLKVTDMSWMFNSAGRFANTINIDISNWNMSNVTNISGIFAYVGDYTTTFNITIPKTNRNGLNNTTTRIYGATSSVYADPPSSTKQYTLAS